MTEAHSNQRKFTLETGLYILALTLALFLRLLNLGSQPLNEQEAGWALEALPSPAQTLQPRSAQAEQSGQAQSSTPGPQSGPQPAYLILTRAAFTLFGDSDFTARLWPVLAGSALVLLPALLRRRLGRKAALVMAFGLAIDPGLIVVSRQAGGPMLALAFGLLALGFWEARRPVWAGILGGLALLSGPAALFGLLVWGLGQAGRALARLRSPAPLAAARPVEVGKHPQAVEAFDERLARPELADDQDSLVPASDTSQSEAGALARPSELRTALLAGLVTFILVGSAFLRYPVWLTAAVYALPSFLLDWVEPATVTSRQMLVLLLVYQPFGLIFALVALGRWVEAHLLYGDPDQEPGFVLPLWGYFLAALLLGLLFSGRQPAHLVFALVPLWGAAAIGLASYLPGRRPNAIAGLQAGIVLILAALLWVWLSSSEVLAPANTDMWWMLRPAIVVGILALAALTTALVALGWQWEYARDGLVWGLVIACAVYSTAALWGAAYLRPNQPQELWAAAPAPGQARLLVHSLDELSLWSQGMPREITVVSLVDTPSLRWALRTYPLARFVASLPPDEQPAASITLREAGQPALAASYRGQDFVWWVRPAWDGVLPPRPVLWLAYRQAPTVNEYIILWAHAALFPGSEAQSRP